MPQAIIEIKRTSIYERRMRKLFVSTIMNGILLSNYPNLYFIKYVYNLTPFFE